MKDAGMKPSDAMEFAVCLAMSDRFRRIYMQPGAVIQSMDKEAREALSRLNSEHTLAMRWYNVDGPEEQARKYASKIKMDFDKRSIFR